MSDQDEPRESRAESSPDNPYSPPAAQVEPGIGTPGEGFVDGEFRPFKTMWTRPRPTIRAIISRDPTLHVWLLASIAGIGAVLDQASSSSLGDEVPLSVILTTAVFVGPFAGHASLWIVSHLIRLSGRLLGGRGTVRHLRTAIAWSALPDAVAVPLWVPQVLLFGSDLFTSTTPRLDASPALWLPFMAFMLIRLGLGLWGLILLCHAMAAVQGYESAWRGFGNLLLAFVVVLAAIVALGVVLLGLVTVLDSAPPSPGH